MTAVTTFLEVVAIVFPLVISIVVGMTVELEMKQVIFNQSLAWFLRACQYISENWHILSFWQLPQRRFVSSYLLCFIQAFHSRSIYDHLPC